MMMKMGMGWWVALDATPLLNGNVGEGNELRVDEGKKKNGHQTKRHAMNRKEQQEEEEEGEGDREGRYRHKDTSSDTHTLEVSF